MHSTEPRGHFIMDLEAEEALRELEAGQQEPSVAPQLPLQDQQTVGSSFQLPGFEVLCSTLKDILGGVDVASTTVGEVRFELAKRLGVNEVALQPWRQQLGDIMEGFMQQAGVADAGLSNIAEDRPKKSWRNHYGGTWSHTDDPRLRSPESMSKGEFGELLLDTAHSIFQVAVAQGKKARLNRFDKASVWCERHQSGKPHYHFICLADDPWSFVPLARALRAKGICVDFSCEHDYYWTSVVYLAVPSSLPGGKKGADLDADPWLSPGHPSVKEILQDIPRGARACDKGRVRRYLGVHITVGKPGKDLAFTDKEFSHHVVAKGLRDMTSLMAWVQEKMKQKGRVPEDDLLAAIGMEAYMYKHQAESANRLAFAWQMHDAPQELSTARKTAWEVVLEAETHSQCTCNGNWIPMTEELLQHHCNNFPSNSPQAEMPVSLLVRKAIVRALKEGCAKFVNVFLYGPNTSGKSHVLKPLAEIFKGSVFLRPVGRGNFPLQQIFGKKVAVLQDVRVSTFKLSFDSLLIWFEGETFPVPMPRNSFKEDKEYSGKAPMFLSSGAKFAIPDKEAKELQLDPYDQNEMMDARFTFFHFPCTLPKAGRRDVSPCPKCFAKWVCSMPQDLCEPTGPPQHQPPPSVAVRLAQELVDFFPDTPSPSNCSPVPQPLPQEEVAFLGATQMWGVAPDEPPSQDNVPTLGLSAAPSQKLAAGIEAVTDWLETHGGEVHLSGPKANVADLSDKLFWSSHFLPSCGRLLPFLRKYGVSSMPDVVTGVVSAAGA